MSQDSCMLSGHRFGQPWQQFDHEQEVSTPSKFYGSYVLEITGRIGSVLFPFRMRRRMYLYHSCYQGAC